MRVAFHLGSVQDPGGFCAGVVYLSALHNPQVLRRRIVCPPAYEAASGNKKDEGQDQSADYVVLQGAALMRPDRQVPKQSSRL
jgi:hypothetical protein